MVQLSSLAYLYTVQPSLASLPSPTGLLAFLLGCAPDISGRVSSYRWPNALDLRAGHRRDKLSLTRSGDETADCSGDTHAGIEATTPESSNVLLWRSQGWESVIHEQRVQWFRDYMGDDWRLHGAQGQIHDLSRLLGVQSPGC
jgi:hypothetical protein